MSDEVNANDLAQNRTNWALNRTVMALERTLMAWLRTAVTLISFGFTLYTILDLSERKCRPSIASERPPERGSVFDLPRNVDADRWNGRIQVRQTQNY